MAILLNEVLVREGQLPILCTIKLGTVLPRKWQGKATKEEKWLTFLVRKQGHHSKDRKEAKPGNRLLCQWFQPSDREHDIYPKNMQVNIL